MFRDGLVVYGPTSTELQGLLEGSQQCRRRLRLLQVRNQAKNEARNIRKKYQLKKKVLEETVAKKLQAAIDSQLNEVLDAKVTEYRDYMDNVGSGHVSASLWHDPKVDLDRKRRVAHEQAVKRFNVALQTQQTKRELKQQDESEPRLRLAEVRAIEQERAHLVAALPKPAPPPYDLGASARVPKQTVLVLDAESQNTAAVYTSSSAVLTTTSPRDSSDKTSNEAQDAVSAAQMEEDRFLLEQQASSLRTKEELIKADVRGREALKRERVQQHYRALLDRLDEIGRTEAARLRSEAKMMKPKDEHAVKRRLEKAFEREILQQLSDTRQQPDDAEFPNSLGHVVRASVWDEMDENAAASDDFQTCGETKRGVLTSRENLMQEIRKDADATHMPTPKPFWTAPNLLSNVPIQNDTDSASSGDLSQKVCGTPKTPFVSPEAKSLSDPCLTLSFEGNIRPGAESLVHDERSELLSLSRPSVISRKESANGRDIVSSATHRVDESPRLRLELDLIRQRALLDEELSTIESRLARLRMAAATNAHIRDENLSTEGVDEPVLTGSLPLVAKQVTPREALKAVEGFAAEDNPDKSSRETPPEGYQPSILTKQPLLKSLPQPCIEQLAALVRAQVSSLCAPLDVPSLTSPTLVSSSSSLVQSDSVSEVQHSPDSVSDTVSGDVTPTLRRSSSSARTALPGDEPLADKVSPFTEPVVGFQTDSAGAFQRSEPTSLSTVCPPNGSPHILDATLDSRENADAPSNVPLAPRLSLIGLSADERAVLKSVNKLAARLTNVAIHEASKELASLSVPTDSVSIPPLPTSSMTLPPAPSQTGDSKFSPSSCSSSTTTGLVQEAPPSTRQANEINNLEPTGTFSSDSLKAELRSLLTSSLINTLLSQTTDSTISTTGLSGTDVLRRILNSHGNAVTNGASLDLQPTQALLTSSDTANFVGSVGEIAPAAVTSPSSVSSSSAEQNGLPSVPVQTTEPIESSPCDENITYPPNHSVAGDGIQTPRLSEHESAIKQIKTRVLHEYITVNKDWLLSLAGQNTKSKSFGAASSVSGSSSRTCSCSSASFRHLSAADGESNEVHDSPPDTKTHAALSVPITASSNGSQHQLTRSQPSTPTWHSSYTAFKPLPRLEEATSEESVQDSSTHLPVLAENANAVVDASRTPSSSWSGSRRSASEFAALSRCSTSNSNLESARRSTPVRLGSTENSPGSCLSSSVERKSTSEDTTLHQLRNRVPSTPAEPQEVEVVPCLGSNMSSASSNRYPDSLIRELLESGEDNIFWLLNQPPPARPSYQAECPPDLTAQTRTTTTIDSSLIWDDMEGNGSKEHPSSQPLVASSDTKVIPSDPSVQPISNSQPSIPDSPTKEPRPSTPAEGATASGRSDRDLPPMFQSLPTVFVDCESDSLTEVYLKKVPFSRDLPLYASWSNFNRFQPGSDIIPSISDSLRSFQQHEKSCLLAEDSPPIAPTHHVGIRSQLKFLDWKPDQIDSNMVRQNAHLIKDVAIPLSKPRAVSTTGRITASRTPHAKTRKTSARAQTIPVDNTAAPQATTANSAVLTRRARNASVSILLRKKPRFRRPSVPARNSFASVKKPDIAANPKMEPCSFRVNRQQDNSRKPHGHEVERRYVDCAPPETRPTLLGAANARFPSSSNSGAPTNSKNVEHTLLQQLGQWRASRFGFRSRTDPHITSTTSKSSAFSTANGWIPQFQSTVSVTFSEHVDFSAIHPGSPPPVVERSFMDDPSSTLPWFDEDSVPGTPVQRPSAPTPAETGRPSTSSEEYSSVPYQFGSSGRGAVSSGFMDYHDVELPPAACAGDEVPVKRQHGVNEVRFTVPDPHGVVRSGGTASQSHNRTQPQPQQSASRANPNPTGLAIRAPDLASRAQQPNDAVSAPAHTSSVDVARASVYRTDRQKQRDELARQNRIRMKEFDQARRERLFRRSRKKTDR